MTASSWDGEGRDAVIVWRTNAGMSGGMGECLDGGRGERECRECDGGDGGGELHGDWISRLGGGGGRVNLGEQRGKADVEGGAVDCNGGYHTMQHSVYMLYVWLLMMPPDSKS